ncbi:hypothetical protein C8046_03435 [Serinibacter arcticus]|uniref:SnoaL-like domain-containing protein n=1 Tax=Serinibacter arcticus TaxID=1655435 RepID=A0A2U1ZSB6_9MICO|nr:nuclear transport factor 2 family protein [Serinibacter arcticus]PWD49877.1 hypothetical protein C8046_03435 [Serinibacter arcticus]
MTTDTPDTASSRATAKKFLQHMLEGDTQALLDLFHEDGTWQIMGETDGFTLLSTHPKAEIAALMHTVASAIAVPHDLTVGDILADGDRAAVEIHPTAQAVNGHRYDNHILFLFHVRAGRIHSLKEYLDTRHLEKITSTRRVEVLP